MLVKIPSKDIFNGDYGWHTGRFHFAFGDYVDPENLQFGSLKALNDFCLHPGTGFEIHPHEEMEIISYCIEGKLTHRDNLGNQATIGRGEIQYLSAGTGITHSEKNGLSGQPLRFLQIWFLPERNGLPPRYLSKHFAPQDRRNKFLHLVSGEQTDGVIRIAQDANIFVSELDRQVQLTFSNQAGRQCYLVCLDGGFEVNGIEMCRYDALKVWDSVKLTLKALMDSHLVIVEMAESS